VAVWRCGGVAVWRCGGVDRGGCGAAIPVLLVGKAAAEPLEPAGEEAALQAHEICGACPVWGVGGREHGG
jgi:hypothetical protein